MPARLPSPVLQMTIGALKAKLATHTGTSAADARLTLVDGSGRVVAPMDDDARPLGFYSPQDGFTIRMVDTNPHSLAATGWLDDVSKVEKYVMSDADYSAREGTYRAHAAAMRAIDPAWTAARELAARRGEAAPEGRAAPGPDFQEDEAAGLSVGARCEVSPGGRRGVIRCAGRRGKGVGRACSPRPPTHAHPSLDTHTASWAVSPRSPPASGSALSMMNPWGATMGPRPPGSGCFSARPRTARLPGPRPSPRATSPPSTSSSGRTTRCERLGLVGVELRSAGGFAKK